MARRSSWKIACKQVHSEAVDFAVRPLCESLPISLQCVSLAVKQSATLAPWTGTTSEARIVCYEQVVARRQTLWDTAIQLITSQSQESNLLTAFVRLICTAMLNCTAGMLCSIFLFAFQLPSMIMSYQVTSQAHRHSTFH